MRIKFSLACILLLSAPSWAQEPKISIVQIWENFIASSEANKRCGVKDEELEKGFMTNLMDIVIRATMKIKEDRPEISDANLAKEIHDRDKAIRAKVDDIIDTKRCGFEGIQKLLSLYKFHAEWRNKK